MSRYYDNDQASYSSAQQPLHNNNPSYNNFPATANFNQYDHYAPDPYSDTNAAPYSDNTTPYSNPNPPYSNTAPYSNQQYNQSAGYITPMYPKKSISPWIKYGIPILVIAIVGGVVGGILGSREHSTAVAAAAASESSASAASAGPVGPGAVGLFADATNSQYMLPIYPSTTNSAAYSTPTFNAANTNLAWPTETFKPLTPTQTSLRPDRPRLIAPSYKWAALPALIASDPYLKSWNDTIFGNASVWYNLPPVIYFMDGDSGILDNSRNVKERVKAFAYVYRMTNDTKWVDRTFVELQNAAGNGTTPFGPDVDRWNSPHFLDTAEMTAAFGIAYDWLYDMWSDQQKSQILWSMNEYGLSFGVSAYTDLDIGWWSVEIQGNWNCVCNNGLTMGALAVLGDDTTGNAEKLLGITTQNALENCIWATSNDGTWSETNDYWYFGTTALAEMTSSLMTATGSDYGLLTENPNLKLSGLFHMYATGTGSLFNYGDSGPNKFSTTANALMFWGSQFDNPQYQLFQRDMPDAAEPWSMFWYDPTVQGAWWDGLALDHYFENSTDQWVSMRSSFTDENRLFVAAKAGTLQNHQTHNDLDVGDFVIDALGTRFAGELGDGDYRSTGYFSNDTQGSDRWLYYRKRSEGQNVVLINEENQLVTAQPTAQFGSTNDVQPGATTVYTPPSDSTAFFTANIASAYNATTSYERGIRLLNGRKQVLLQDDITTSGSFMWRMHTNATVDIGSSGTSATLTIGQESLIMNIVNPPDGAQITIGNATRFATDPPLPPGMVDQPNTGVTVVMITLPSGQYSLQVLFNPQWSGMAASDYVTPPSVPVTQWSLTSHN